MPHDLRGYLDFAIDTAREAGRLTLDYFQSDDLRATRKSDDSPVTIADRTAEQCIRSRIAEAFPEHGIVGEEFGANDRDTSCRWFIDPIDGTRAFVRGVPLYAVLLGLEIDGRSAVGVAHFPALDEIISAATGHGCLWNGQPAHVSNIPLRDGILTHANVTSFDAQDLSAPFHRLTEAAGFCAGWADAYGYLLVATGRAEVALDPIMSPWDCAPFPVILREAGGYFGDWSGNETIHSPRTLATTATLLPDVLSILHENADKGQPTS
jgi:myo-inositol-1(or 4)-monophosphatase